MAFVRDEFGGGLPPDDVAALARETENFKGVGGIRVLDVKDPLGLVFRFWQRGVDDSGVDCGQQEHLVLPDDGCGTSVSVDGDFPLDIVFLAPFDWRRRRSRNAIRFRAAPLVPVVGRQFVE